MKVGMRVKRPDEIESENWEGSRAGKAHLLSEAESFMTDLCVLSS